MTRDPYEVLGVPRTASEAEIRHAFWGLAKRYHPDVNGGDPAAARMFLEVGNAAETLLDPRRRDSHDESRMPGTPAGPPAAAPKPPPPPRTSRPAGTQAAAPKPPPRPRTSRAAGTPPLAPLVSTGRGRGGLPWRAVLRIVAFVAMVSIIAIAKGAAISQGQPEGGDVPDNGAVVWKTAGFGLADGWGINLVGHGMRIQIVPGTSTDIEVTYGYLASAGHIALLPPGEALTYQHCVSAVQQATDQAEPLSEIGPASRSGLCVHGSGGDLASIQVTHDDGSSITASITVWEYV